ncbi:MAG: hypothetical protein ACE5FB_03770 [Candidatus Binatia bacterium]
MASILQRRIAVVTAVVLLGVWPVLVDGDETSPPDVKETIFIIEMEQSI